MLRRLPPAQKELERRRTEAQLAAVKRDADGIRKRCETLRGFVKEAWPVLEPVTPLKWGWCLDAMTDHLQGVLDGHILRLRMNVPPGLMKSLLTSVCLNAYEWGPAGRPSMGYLTASWKDTFAARDSRKTRDLVQSPWYQELWGDKVKLTTTAEAEFANTARGYRTALPMLGLTSGRGDRLVIDDPHSTETAESDAVRRKTTRIFRESITSRINDPIKSPIVVIMQRLHAQDVSGVIEELGGYTSLILPMEFEPDRRCHTVIGLQPDGQRKEFTDPRREKNELLFPERFPRDVVERDKIFLGAYAVAGQYQQRPAPRDGGKFARQWFGIVDAVPAGGRYVRAWDLASTEGGGDFTVGVLMCLAGGIYYIVDVVRDRMSPAKVDAAIKNTAEQDFANHGYAVSFRLPQDPGQAGKSQKASHSALLAKYPFRILPVTGDKQTRARPLSSQAEAGNVKLVRGPWNTTFLDEIGMFPNAGFDDQVDAAADAYNELVGTAYSSGDIAAPIIVTAGRPSPG